MKLLCVQKSKRCRLFLVLYALLVEFCGSSNRHKTYVHTSCNSAGHYFELSTRYTFDLIIEKDFLQSLQEVAVSSSTNFTLRTSE